MANRRKIFACSLAFASAIGLAAPADAQRTRQGNATTAGNQVKKGTAKAGTARNTNVNRNTTVNRNTNVNANRNVNVNRNVDVHVWNGNRVHAGRYAWPPGHAYGRRAVGYIMPRPFLASTYYYSGWRALGLAAPMAGHQWIRYGEDLLLVQTGTGRVVDVRYGVFG